MSNITITKNNEGKLVGLTQRDQRAYARFKKSVDGMEEGEIATISIWFPRNPAFHKKHLKMLREVFSNQEQFDDFDDGFRKWVQIGAGYYISMPGPNGRQIDVSKSIAWDKMDDEALNDHHEKVKEFLRSSRARMFLWPHLAEGQTYEMVDTLLREFEE